MNPFAYSRASDAAGAVTAIAAKPHTKFLGGGTNLIDLMKMGVETPAQLVDITRLPLAQVEELRGGTGVRIAALAALDAVVRVQGPKGEREIPIADFHRLPGSTPNVDTNLKEDELITAVDLPATPFAARSHYLKVRDRASYAFAIVSVAAAIEIDAGKKITAVRIALGGVAHKPWRAQKAEQQLVGKTADEKTFRADAETELAAAKGYAHNSFKIELAKRSIVRALSTVADMTS